ncbi:ABC transporter ATP-binding protein [Nocardia flavorosea]|uniref:ABC transporter ATP-binding protein n=1 Tax=Nocardia flavorosea TaxID=53429 RepID=A0A846YG42_9NOCA|nr:ABC transporter ATP-binding protein [Nocardia flavorosea]NKY57917.1 ABC transporter ATP-binding protein [Nocardia flavorosea]
MSSEPLLAVTGLTAGYGAGEVLHGIDFSVTTGEICAVLGPNGAGKTTLLRALSGLVRVRGSVTLAGAEIGGRAPEKIARAGVAHVPEGRGTFAPLTVEENLRLGAYSRGGARFRRGGGSNRCRRGGGDSRGDGSTGHRRTRGGLDTDLRRVYDYFPVLRDKLHEKAGRLSGGQQQMLALGRALMSRPRLLLLDEPSLGLAPMVTRELFRIVHTINSEEHTTVIVVEQNAQLALRTAHRAHVLESGRIVLSGAAADIAADEQVARSYLGYRV